MISKKQFVAKALEFYPKRKDFFEITLSCKAFSNEDKRDYNFIIDPYDGEIKVYDTIAKYFTSWNALSDSTKSRVYDSIFNIYLKESAQ